MKNAYSVQSARNGGSLWRTSAKCLTCDSTISPDFQEFPDTSFESYDMYRQSTSPQIENALSVWGNGNAQTLNSSPSLPSFNPSNARHSLEAQKGWGKKKYFTNIHLFSLFFVTM